MAKTKVLKAPFNGHGLMSYPDAFYMDPAKNLHLAADRRGFWKDNDPFDATLKVIRYERGRSSAIFILESTETGLVYPMFMSDFTQLVTTKMPIDIATYQATWIVKKAGQNYGVGLYTE